MDVFHNPVIRVHLLINDLLDIRFRGYDMISILEFHVHAKLYLM
jgi:uncharacterized protein YbgA (DUF1722 family)